MLYQLIHHDKTNSFVFVVESPSLQTSDEATAWFQNEIQNRELPEGRFWGLVDEKHPAFANQSIIVPEQPTFEDVIRVQSEVWKKEMIAEAEYQQRLAEHLANFPG